MFAAVHRQLIEAEATVDLVFTAERLSPVKGTNVQPPWNAAGEPEFRNKILSVETLSCIFLYISLT